MDREDDDGVAADGTEQIEKAVMLGRIEPGGWLIDDDDAGVPERCLCNTEALLHAAGRAGECFLANVPKVGLLQESIDDIFAFARCSDALHDLGMIQHIDGGYFRIDAKFL